MNSIKLYGTFFCLVITLYCGVKIALQPSKAEIAQQKVYKECMANDAIRFQLALAAVQVGERRSTVIEYAQEDICRKQSKRG